MTGTRGKSSVTRLIAGFLSATGVSVLAKTTGSHPAVILPDGSEEEIKRRGSPSILEGKKILRIGTKRGVQALVMELMGIQPESMFAESVQMIKPHILIITNIRLDHLVQMGSSREEIAHCFSSVIPKRSTVFVPKEEFFSVFQRSAEKLKSRIIQVPKGSSAEVAKMASKLPFIEIEENIRLCLSVAGFLGIDKETAFRGIQHIRPDFGSLKVWSAEWGVPSRRGYLVSAFAANDPESTKRVLDKLRQKSLLEGKKMIGLLNLRSDRGDRTLQWQDALRGGGFREFHKFVLLGEHAAVFKKRLKSSGAIESCVLKKRKPEEIMAHLAVMEKREAVWVGLGNMGGVGKSLVNYWNRIGRPYGI